MTLEAGQDMAKTGNPVQSSKNFVQQITTPDFPWTAWTISLVAESRRPQFSPGFCRCVANVARWRNLLRELARGKKHNSNASSEQSRNITKWSHSLQLQECSL